MAQRLLRGEFIGARATAPEAGEGFEPIEYAGEPRPRTTWFFIDFGTKRGRGREWLLACLVERDRAEGGRPPAAVISSSLCTVFQLPLRLGQELRLLGGQFAFSLELTLRLRSIPSVEAGSSPRAARRQCDHRRSTCHSKLSGSDWASCLAIAEAVAIRAQRRRHVCPVRTARPRSLLYANAQVPLPFRVPRVGLRQTLPGS